MTDEQGTPPATEPLEVSYSQEQADPDQSLLEAWNTTGQRHGVIRMRLQPQLLIDRPGRARKSMYLSWRNVWWNLDLPDVRTGIAFREALTSFMRLLEFEPAKEIQKLLDLEAKRLAELQILKAETEPEQQ